MGLGCEYSTIYPDWNSNGLSSEFIATCFIDSAERERGLESDGAPPYQFFFSSQVVLFAPPLHLFSHHVEQSRSSLLAQEDGRKGKRVGTLDQ